MNDHARPIHKTKPFPELASPEVSNAQIYASGNTEADSTYEERFRQVGLNYRIGGDRRSPEMRLMLEFTNGNSREINYSHITDRSFQRQWQDTGFSGIEIFVRDTMRVFIQGYNLDRLNDDLQAQRVVDIGAVPHVQAEAALRTTPDLPVITRLTLQFGRMDLEYGEWIESSGHWSDEEQRWIAERPEVPHGSGRSADL